MWRACTPSDRDAFYLARERARPRRTFRYPARHSGLVRLPRLPIPNGAPSRPILPQRQPKTRDCDWVLPGGALGARPARCRLTGPRSPINFPSSPQRLLLAPRPVLGPCLAASRSTDVQLLAETPRPHVAGTDHRGGALLHASAIGNPCRFRLGRSLASRCSRHAHCLGYI